MNVGHCEAGLVRRNSRHALFTESLFGTPTLQLIPNQPEEPSLRARGTICQQQQRQQHHTTTPVPELTTHPSIAPCRDTVPLQK